ncbi:hypothetical protein [Xylanibacter rarus]|uniref:hypothetical protein n=1 Tax=Xylanibacter rarus TaxID=1676614 RepID=UPI003AB95A31
MTDLALTNLIPNKNPQEYQIFHFFPFRFSLNNVSLFVNISDIFRPFDALRIAMFIASLWFGVKNGKNQTLWLSRCHSMSYAVASSR